MACDDVINSGIANGSLHLWKSSYNIISVVNNGYVKCKCNNMMFLSGNVKPSQVCYCYKLCNINMDCWFFIPNICIALSKIGVIICTCHISDSSSFLFLLTNYCICSWGLRKSLVTFIFIMTKFLVLLTRQMYFLGIVSVC